MPTPSIDQLKRAITISEQIEMLQAELGRIVGDSSSVASAPKAAAASTSKKTGKRTMSPVTIAKMKAAQQARWAKKKGSSTPVVKTPAAAPKKAKRKLSPEGRARIVAALKARWAARKKGAPALNSPEKVGGGNRTTQKKANKTTTIYR